VRGERERRVRERQGFGSRERDDGRRGITGETLRARVRDSWDGFVKGH
jgi:hypothetical protein